MRNFIVILLISAALSLKGQVADSSWIVKTYQEPFSKDTGKILPDFRFVDEKGNQRTLADFRGKIVYVDVWTTWCGNCINQFPYTKQLQKRLKAVQLDTAIQFINICTEDSRAAWKKALKKYQPAGINLYAKDTSLYALWDINSFPRYILIDSSGEIMSYQFLRPADSYIDYILYAASKGIQPVEAVWINFRQQQYFQKHKEFTNNEEGRDYAKWYKSIVSELIEYFKWRQSQVK